jgi:bacterioferritin
MKGNEKLLKVLNQCLADELTGVNQYMVQAEMCSNWGYGKLHNAIDRQATDEIHHAEWLIQRIIFLEGTPSITMINQMKIGKTVFEMMSNDKESAITGVESYISSINFVREEADKGSIELLTEILKMEEEHINWAEIQLQQIEQMGMDHYLANQIEKSAA